MDKTQYIMDKRVIGNSISWTDRKMYKKQYIMDGETNGQKGNLKQYIMDGQTNGQKTVYHGRTDKWTKNSISWMDKNSVSWMDRQMDKRVIGNSISWKERQMDKNSI
jgi:hypothetical protein